MEQLSLNDEPGWTDQLSMPSSPVLVEFAMQGLIISFQAEQLKREQAVEMFQRWFPDAEVIPDQLAPGGQAPRRRA